MQGYLICHILSTTIKRKRIANLVSSSDCIQMRLCLNIRLHSYATVFMRNESKTEYSICVLLIFCVACLKSQAKCDKKKMCCLVRYISYLAYMINLFILLPLQKTTCPLHMYMVIVG